MRPSQLRSEIIAFADRDPAEPRTRIDRVGGAGWTRAEGTVIEEIEEGHAYYADLADGLVPVLVVEHHGERFLRTDPAETSANRLLSLPPCS